MVNSVDSVLDLMILHLRVVSASAVTVAVAVTVTVAVAVPGTRFVNNLLASFWKQFDETRLSALWKKL